MDNLEKLEKSLDRVFSILNILKIALDKESFETWLKLNHNLEINEILPGYRLFITTGLRSFMEAIFGDSNLNLKEDYVAHRLRYVDIDFKDIPNSCEKIIFLKNIWNLSKSIRKATSPDEISSRDLLPIFDCFDEIYNNYVISEDVEKNQALLISSIFKLHLLFNCLLNGLPEGYYCSLLSNSLKDEHLNKSFKGYVLTLQYVWSTLLEGNSFENTIISKLHDTEYLNKLFGSKNTPNIYDIIDNSPLNPDWRNLDRCSGVINKELLEPLRDKYPMWIHPMYLYLNKNPEKELFKDFLKKDNLKEPDYLVKTKLNDNLLKKRLDYLFYWHKLYTLDTQGIHVFNGTYAVLTTLLGHLELNNILDDKIDIKILKLNHPVAHPYRKDAVHTSYAIHFGVYGEISDGSGWLVFLNCSVNFESPEFLQFELEDTLNDLKDEIELIEYNVDLNSFTKYLQQKSIKFDPRLLEVDSIDREFKSYHGKVKGRVFENLSYLIINELEEGITTWSEIINNEEIDILRETNDEIHIYECKVDSHLDSDYLEQINRKINAVAKEYDKKIVPHIIFYYGINPMLLNTIEENNIQVTHNLRKKFAGKSGFKKFKPLFEIIEYSPDNIMKHLTNPHDKFDLKHIR
ncbi:hypothetical protein [Methanococcus maripaludis]|uniref:Uncharacterized protein n=1 Tax=Methanococcus maripaludis TaxID=39152 RepID=A0A7J9PNX3_METMI|nr:hypothetical protein [Methanococcus maripaludis]MBA2864416.1 hypothetical protein [Methanococcus maripaludis]